MKRYMYIAIAIVIALVFIGMQMKKASGLEVSVDEVKKMKDEKTEFVLIDVREPGEWAQGHIKGATLIPLGSIESQIEKKLPKLKKTDKIVTQCRSGARSLRAAMILKKLGYEDVMSMKGGILAWQRDGNEVVK